MPASDQGVFPDRYQIIPRVLVFAIDDGRVLLLKGAPAKRLWANQNNGVGGHIEQGESVMAAARREFQEETGLELSSAHLAAVVMIDTGEPIGISMHVFQATAQPGELKPSAEGTLEWVPFEEIFNRPLVEDLPKLLPIVLNWHPGEPPIFAKYSYNKSQELHILWNE
ncbi:MAG: NUDIX domain-containing protein [Anaerolineae bacterium]|nr:MAG: NUDIX domain-containing protein [Anaerolineae bacterium]